MVYPHHDEVSQDYPDFAAKESVLADFISVARVRPRTSKGITDLLLPHTSDAFVASVPLRSRPSAKSERDYLAG